MIFDIDHFAVHDGPGIRTTVYLKGCPLRCMWCHSPESQSAESEVLFSSHRCTGCMKCVDGCGAHAVVLDGAGKRTYDKSACSHCFRCVLACPSGALTVSGRAVDSEEVIDEASQDSVFYKNSGGGVTLTGGEVLHQPDFAIEILKGLKGLGIHTIVETSGMGAWGSLETMASYTDVFYYDLKIINPAKHKLYCGADNGVIIGNLQRLRMRTGGIVICLPLIPGITDTFEDIDAVYEKALELDIRDVRLLPYNRSAQAKYELLGRGYGLTGLEGQGADYLSRLIGRAPERLSVSMP